MSADDMKKLRAEFVAMENYRQALLNGLMRVSKRIAEAGAESVSALESPAVSQSDVYWRGFAAGQCEAYGSSAAAVSELHVCAALGVEAQQ